MSPFFPLDLNQVRAVRLHLAGYVDESVLWAESDEDLGDGFRRVHMLNNIDFIFDAEASIPDLGGARDGTRLILFRWNGGLNQQWRIAPHRAPAAAVAELPEHARPVRILCQSGQGLSLTVRDRTAVLARADDEDECQVLLCSARFGLCTVRQARRCSPNTSMQSFLCVCVSRAVLDPELPEHRPRDGRRGTPGVRAREPGHREGAGALPRRRAGTSVSSPVPSAKRVAPRELAMYSSATLGAHVFARQVYLAGHNPDSVDVALLWTQSNDLGQGFHNIRTVSDVDTVLDAANAVPEVGGAHDGTPVIVFPWNDGSNQKWKMLPFY
jgi:hypothetical protein